MAIGISTVTTKIGIEGIEISDSASILYADSTEKIVEQICFIFSNPEAAASISEKAIKAIRETYSWKSSINHLAELYIKIKKLFDFPLSDIYIRYKIRRPFI